MFHIRLETVEESMELDMQKSPVRFVMGWLHMPCAGGGWHTTIKRLKTTRTYYSVRTGIPYQVKHRASCGCLEVWKSCFAVVSFLTM